jgi:hypothetical protein
MAEEFGIKMRITLSLRNRIKALHGGYDWISALYSTASSQAALRDPYISLIFEMLPNLNFRTLSQWVRIAKAAQIQEIFGDLWSDASK